MLSPLCAMESRGGRNALLNRESHKNAYKRGSRGVPPFLDPSGFSRSH
jgi:hypothetical protein